MDVLDKQGWTALASMPVPLRLFAVGSYVDELTDKLKVSEMRPT